MQLIICPKCGKKGKWKVETDKEIGKKKVFGGYEDDRTFELTHKCGCKLNLYVGS